MTREKIIEIIDKTQGVYEVFRKRGVYIIEENKIDEFADELLALAEQEKKEVFKKGYEEGYDNGYDDCDAKHFAEEYGGEV